MKTDKIRSLLKVVSLGVIVLFNLLIGFPPGAKAEPPKKEIKLPASKIDIEELRRRTAIPEHIISHEEIMRARLKRWTLSLVDTWNLTVEPYAIDICQGGPVLVSDVIRKILVYSLDGTYQTEWSIPKVANEGIRGLTVDKRIGDGSIYVAMYGGGDYVYVLNRNGVIQNKWQGTINGQNQITPHGFIVLPDGNLIISDDMNHCLQIFKPDGTYVRTIGSQGGGEGQFSNPRQLAYDDRNDEIYVMDRGNHRVQVIHITGSYRRGWGSEGSAAGQFNQPHGIALDKNKNIVYVGDTYNNRIQVFTTTGDFICEWKDPGFKEPRYMALDSAGQLYVTSYLNKKVGIFQLSEE